MLLKDLRRDLNLFGTQNPIVEEMRGFRREYRGKTSKFQENSWNSSLEESTRQEIVPIFIIHPNGRIKAI